MWLWNREGENREWGRVWDCIEINCPNICTFLGDGLGLSCLAEAFKWDMS